MSLGVVFSGKEFYKIDNCMVIRYVKKFGIVLQDSINSPEMAVDVFAPKYSGDEEILYAVKKSGLDHCETG